MSVSPAVVATLFVLLVLAAVALKAATPDERARLFRSALAIVREIRDAAALNRERCQPFHEALKARTKRVLMTPALAALIALAFVGMLAGAHPIGSVEALIGWGGNVGLHTTNNEWWRLVTSLFVHAGLLHLLVNVAALVQLGLILERFAGRYTFATVFFASGVFGNLTALRADSVVPKVGASGAIFGLYGLLLASIIWCAIQASTLTIPRVALKRLIPSGTLFVLYNLGSGTLGLSAEATGLVAGTIAGFVLARGIGTATAPVRTVGVTAAAALVLAAAAAVPLRGVTDVRPEIARLVAIEDQSVEAYQSANEQFKKRRITAEGLASVIERSIMPELRAADARLKALDRVPEEHQAMLAGAGEYVRLRIESWRLRIQGLRNTVPARHRPDRVKAAATENVRRTMEVQHTTRMAAFGNAEAAERSAREALDRVRPAAVGVAAR